MKRLFKTTIVIWSDYPTDSVELEDIARQAVCGDMYCSDQTCEEITNEDEFPDTEFFDET